MRRITMLNDAVYESLAYAIIEQAVNDYFHSKFYLDTIEDRFVKVENGLSYRRRINELCMPYKSRVKECEDFFKSEWFETLANGVIDPYKAFDTLNNTYQNEYYPRKYEDFFAREYKKHARYFVQTLKTICTKYAKEVKE
jgi:hypothetical protein